jgi:hypothetical protein
MEKIGFQTVHWERVNYIPKIISKIKNIRFGKQWSSASNPNL